MTIVSAGEALMDLLPASDAEGRPTLRAVPGGSPFNVAIGLGRLGLPAAFLGAVSEDPFGARIMAALAEAQVDASLVTRVRRPTPLAVAQLEGGEASYSFYDAGTAARGLTLREMKPLPPGATMFHFGSLALAAEPAASSLIARATVASAKGLVAIDLNVRPGFAAKETAYRRFLEAAIATAHLVKASEADLAWLRPGMPPDEFAAERLHAGAALVVLTRGAEGARGFAAAGAVTAPPVPVGVVDTIGAGDAFMAGLLAALYEAGLRSRPAVAGIDRDALSAAMAFAARVAAFTCTRAGADPPWREELAAEPFP